MALIKVYVWGRKGLAPGHVAIESFQGGPQGNGMYASFGPEVSNIKTVVGTKSKFAAKADDFPPDSSNEDANLSVFEFHCADVEAMHSKFIEMQMQSREDPKKNQYHLFGSMPVGKDGMLNCVETARQLLKAAGVKGLGDREGSEHYTPPTSKHFSGLVSRLKKLYAQSKASRDGIPGYFGDNKVDPASSEDKETRRSASNSAREFGQKIKDRIKKEGRAEGGEFDREDMEFIYKLNSGGSQDASLHPPTKKTVWKSGLAEMGFKPKSFKPARRVSHEERESMLNAMRERRKKLMRERAPNRLPSGGASSSYSYKRKKIPQRHYNLDHLDRRRSLNLTPEFGSRHSKGSDGAKAAAGFGSAALAFAGAALPWVVGAAVVGGALYGVYKLATHKSSSSDFYPSSGDSEYYYDISSPMLLLKDITPEDRAIMNLDRRMIEEEISLERDKAKVQSSFENQILSEATRLAKLHSLSEIVSYYELKLEMDLKEQIQESRLIINANPILLRKLALGMLSESTLKGSTQKAITDIKKSLILYPWQGKVTAYLSKLKRKRKTNSIVLSGCLDKWDFKGGIPLQAALLASKTKFISSASYREYERCASEFGFLVQDVSDDGNCFFYALLDQILHRKDGEHALARYATYSNDDLRGIAIQGLVERGDLHDFIDNPALLVSRLSNDREWADDFLISTIARVLGISIVLLNSDSLNPSIIYGGREGIVYLGYHPGVHFESLRGEPSEYLKALIAEKWRTEPPSRIYVDSLSIDVEDNSIKGSGAASSSMPFLAADIDEPIISSTENAT